MEIGDATMRRNDDGTWHWRIEGIDGELVADGVADDFDAALEMMKVVTERASSNIQ